MGLKTVVLVDTRGGNKGNIGDDYLQYQAWAGSINIALDILETTEQELNVVQQRLPESNDCIGLLLLRDTSSEISSLAIEGYFSQVKLPIVEVFIDSLGIHQPIEYPLPNRKIIRTIYGRSQRGVFWATQFLKHCRDYSFQTLAYGRTSSHIGDLFLPETAAPYPVVMLIHGGYWRDGYYRDSTHGLAADLARRGFAVWNIEYRRLGASGGGYPESHEDILNALNFLEKLAREYPLDLEQVTIIGHSAGGYLALWGSSIPEGPLAELMPVPEVEVKLGVSIAGVTDLDEAHKEGGAEQAATKFLKEAAHDLKLRIKLSAGYFVYAPETDLMLVHGTTDEYVPIELSEHTYDLLKGRKENVELQVYPETGHNEFVDPESEVWKDLVEKIEEKLDLEQR